MVLPPRGSATFLLFRVEGSIPYSAPLTHSSASNLGKNTVIIIGKTVSILHLSVTRIGICVLYKCPT